MYDQPDSPRGRFHVEAEIVSEDDTAHQHLAKANHALAGYLFCTGGDLSVDAFANGFPRCFSERVAKMVWGLVPATILPALP